MSAVRTVLGFDFGTRRIGVAVGQDLTGSARPLATVAVRRGRVDWAAIARLVEQWCPDGFVVGLPRGVDDEPHALVPDIERFARRLAGRFARPVAFVDEHLSSYAAAAARDVDHAGLDAAAARVILETWFAAERDGGRPDR